MSKPSPDVAAPAAGAPYAGVPGGGRRRPVLRVLGLGVVVLAVVLGVAWFLPVGSHAAYDSLAEPRTRDALTALGEVRDFARPPKGPMQSSGSRALSVRLPGGERVAVTAYRYRGAVAARGRAWLMSPARNFAAWDEPNRWTPDQRGEWRLPDGASLHGLLCQTGTHAGQCSRYVVWWPRGADIVLLDLVPAGLTTPDDAAATLRPVWEALA